MAELIVNTASRPILQAKSEFNVTYEYDITPAIRQIPEPVPTTGIIDLMSSNTFIITLKDTMPSSGVWIYGEDWTYVSGSVTIEGDPTNPYSRWHIAGGPYDEVWYASSGLLPTGYTRYELMGINYLQTYGVYQGRILYKYDDDGNVVPMCSATALTTRTGSVGSVSYSVDLKQTFDPYNTITVTGSSTEGHSVHSPYGVLALMNNFGGYAARGKQQGEIIMTETSIT